jgi:hypothetical protein
VNTNNEVDTLAGLEVFFKEKTSLSYEKTVKVIKDGQELYAFLKYDEWDGYSINWTDVDYKEVEEPTWATEYAEANSYHDLAYLLDEMAVEK